MRQQRRRARGEEVKTKSLSKRLINVDGIVQAVISNYGRYQSEVIHRPD